VAVAGDGRVVDGGPDTNATTPTGAADGNATTLGEVIADEATVAMQSSSLDWQLRFDGLDFAYHKPLLPMDWRHDGASLALAVLGLVIAASGGIGGGGILVPLFMLVLGFKPKHAIALSNFTILGGAIANTTLNVRKRHPELNRGLIDWDLILIMEPLTIFGAVLGSLISKVVPNVALTASLVVILAFMGNRTMKKGLKMWREESKLASLSSAPSDVELMPTNGHAMAESGGDASELAYAEMQSDSECPEEREMPVACKVTALTMCFVGTCALTVLKGGGNFASPLGFDCGSTGFWWLYFGSLPWVLAFALYFRWLLVREFNNKCRRGYVFSSGEVQWDSHNTIKYPIYCAVAGLLAGLFGVGGGIVKGPLMLEMGIQPSVASASAAAMILFTSAAASTSFIVFGLLHIGYGVVFFLLGFVATAIGQYAVGLLVERHNRQSPIVLSIGLVICLSSLFVGLNTVASLLGPSAGELFQAHAVCTTEA